MKRSLLSTLVCVSLLVFIFFFAHAVEKRALRDAVRYADNVATTIPIQMGDFSSLDYLASSDASYYPDQVTVDLKDSYIKQGSSRAFVFLEVSSYSPNTIVAIIKCSNKKGRALKEPKVQAVIYRPGDNLIKAVECQVDNAKHGDVIAFSQVHVPDGALAGERFAIAKVTQNETHLSVKPKIEGRLPFKFEAYGTLNYELDIGSTEIVDNERTNTWSTALSHGRTQPANPENGYYGTLKMGAVSREGDRISLNTKRLEKPIDFRDGGKVYPFMSAVLSGHTNPETFFKYGSIEWEARMPAQKGTWPALWLLPTSGWPPEIDVYEGFSHNNEWVQSVGLSSYIHGGRNNKRSFKRGFLRLQLSDIGLSGNLTTEFHKYQAIITPKWITVFVDDVETLRFENTFKGKTWYPIMTVAVRGDTDKPYDESLASMEIRSLKIWKAF